MPAHDFDAFQLYALSGDENCDEMDLTIGEQRRISERQTIKEGVAITGNESIGVCFPHDTFPYLHIFVVR